MGGRAVMRAILKKRNKKLHQIFSRLKKLLFYISFLRIIFAS